MSTPTCVRCGSPLADGAYACARCSAVAARQLAEIVELIDAARDVAQRQARRGDRNGSSGKPGSQMPISLWDTERLNQVRDQLHRVGGKVWAIRNTYPPFATGVDPIAVIARWLPTQLDWLRHRSDADDTFATIAAAVRIIASVANGPTAGRYAGPCSTAGPDGKACGEDVTARPGSAIGTCKACGAEYDVDEQQEWMRKEIEGYLARPAEIAGVLLRLGFPIGYSTIAAYAAKGQIIAHGSDEKGRALFRIGDVIDLRIEANKPRQARQRSRGVANPHGG